MHVAEKLRHKFHWNIHSIIYFLFESLDYTSFANEQPALTALLLWVQQQQWFLLMRGLQSGRKPWTPWLRFHLRWPSWIAMDWWFMVVGLNSLRMSLLVASDFRWLIPQLDSSNDTFGSPDIVLNSKRLNLHWCPELMKSSWCLVNFKTASTWCY